MPEALETWPVALMQQVLPRHLEIIFRINAGVPGRGRRAPPGRQRVPARLSLIDESRRAPRAHGASVDRRQPQGQRRVGAAFGPAGEDHLRRLRQPVARALHQHDQRRHAAPLAGAGQSGTLVAARCAPSAAAGASISTSCSGWHRMPSAKTSATPSWPSSTRTRRGWPTTSAPAPAGSSIRPACSTCRSSASTSTSASCSTCCTWWRATRRCWPTPAADWVPRTVIFAGKAASQLRRRPRT